MHFNPLSLSAYSKSFWLKHLVPALVVAILMLMVYPSLQLDRYLTGLFFDVAQQKFLLKHHPFLTQWMHIGLKWLMVIIALGCLFLSFASYKFTQLQLYRKSFLWVFVGMVLATAAVAVLKRYSEHACPWDLAIYGGDSPFFELFAMAPLGIASGRCFPAGHPSGGFALMAFYFAFIHIKPRFANRMLILGLSVGLVMGIAQVMRGAHFLSHILWSGWVVWVVLLLLYAIWPPAKAQSASGNQ